MCGRARCTLRPDDVPRASHRHGVPARFLHLDRYRPSYNAAPGSYMPVLRRDNEVGVDGVAVHCMKWGLVPGFTKKTDKPDFFKMFNARSESVAEKASFRRLLPKNRCLVAVDGFYEWKKEGSKKQPYYIHFKDGRPLLFAALFDSWQNSGGETLYTFTILTTTSSSSLQWLHDRMPVILGDKDSVDTWLDDPSTLKLKPLLAPYENSDLVWYPVTSAIGKLSFDGPECIQQITLKASQNSLISKFFATKQSKTEEGEKETRSTDATIPADSKEEVYEGVVVSDSNKKVEELDEENDETDEAENAGFQKIVKAEQLIEDNSTVASHLEPVKDEVEEETNRECRSIKTGFQKIVKAEQLIEDDSTVASHLESVKDEVEEYTNQERRSPNLDHLPRISKEEPESQGHCLTTFEESNQLEHPHEAVQEKPGNESQKTVSACETTTMEGGLEFSGKSGTKRDYGLFSVQEKPCKHSERLQEDVDKGRVKQGKGKSNIKKPKEMQSTLHYFFDEK